MTGHVFPRSFLSPYLEAEYGEGVHIVDRSGRRFLDACSGSLVSALGHGVPEIASAIADQCRKLEYVHSSRWRCEAVREAAREVAAIAPSGLDTVWFVSGGSEANESALKLARQYFVERDGPGSAKRLTISRWNSYHGNTIATMALGGMGRRRPFLPLFEDSPKIETHYCYRCAFGLAYPDCNLRCARQLETLIRRIGSANVSSFIAEPVVGAAVGALPPPPEYWPMVRDICDRYDILLIADEVMTGCGRTGANFAVDHWGVVPDILSAAKGLAAGYVPAGCIVASDHLVETLRDGSGSFGHGHSYQGSPVGAAATAACLRYMRDNAVLDNVLGLEPMVREGLETMQRQSAILGEVRGLGLMWGGELVRDKTKREPFAPEDRAAAVLADQCLDRELVIYPGGGMVDGVAGDNFLFGPPLVSTPEEVREMLARLSEALRATEKVLLS